MKKGESVIRAGGVFVMEKREKEILYLRGGAKVFQGEDMDRYNAEHYRDMTAAIAISRADKVKPVTTRKRGRYLIGDVYRFKWENGVLRIWRSG